LYWNTQNLLPYQLSSHFAWRLLHKRFFKIIKYQLKEKRRRGAKVVLPFDFLDTMAWDVAASGILLAAAAIALRYDPITASIAEENRKLKLGFAAAIGACGFYLFISGAVISFIWPFTISSGVYNVLFGGIATLGGLVLLAGALALFLNADLRPITYLATVAGVYSIVDAYAIASNGLTSSPLLAALGYLSFAAPAFLSIPAAHSKSKLWRWLFTIAALVFAAAWLYQAANFTLAHLQPS
jgi:uncharacterized membrane protein